MGIAFGAASLKSIKRDAVWTVTSREVDDDDDRQTRDKSYDKWQTDPEVMHVLATHGNKRCAAHV